VHKALDLRSRPHKAHLTDQNIDQLWKLVDFVPPDEMADACDPIIIEACAIRPPSMCTHAAKFKDAKESSMQPHPLSSVENWARTF